MNAHPIDLDRRFEPWPLDQLQNPEYLHAARSFGNLIDWPKLLKHRRVVLLAEAGSGKTTEFDLQSSRLQAIGKHSFVVTLLKIGQRGFADTLSLQEQTRFQHWRDSGEPAWLFLDSFDEAKQVSYRMVDVLKEVASAIDGVEGRIHIILSGRYSDWEFKADLRTLLSQLLLPPPDAEISSRNPNEALIAALNEEVPAPTPEPEPPLIVLMVDLDRERVQKFAVAQKVKHVQEFLEVLDHKNLWRLARRPIDLDWLVSYWRKTGDLGPWSVMLEVSIRERLQEPDPHRRSNDNLDTKRALQALERIGAALVLGHVDSIRLPDSVIDLADDIAALDLKEVLPDWRPADLKRLYTRPIFQATAPGYVRLSNDNEGEVRGFLTACWFRRLLSENNCPWSRIKSLLFADTYGEILVRPSLRSSVAWLSLWDTRVRKEALGRDPQLLIDAGDPGSLQRSTRVQALDLAIEHISTHEYPNMPAHDALMHLAQPDMASIIVSRWEQNERDQRSTAVRELLLRMIWLGRLTDCADLALTAALAGYLDRDSLLYAGRAIAEVGDDDQKLRYVAYLLENVSSVRALVIWDALDNLFPAFFTIEDFLVSLPQLNPKSHSAWYGIDDYGPKLMARVHSKSDALTILQTLLRLPSVSPSIVEESEENDYLKTLEAIATRLLELSPAENVPVEAIEAAMMIGRSRRYRYSVGSGDKDASGLFAQLHSSPERRRTGLGLALSRIRQAGHPNKVIRSLWQLSHRGYHPGLVVDDVSWLIDDITTKSDPSDVEFAAHAVMALWKDSGKDPTLLKRIQDATKTIPTARQTIDSWLNPPAPSEDEKEYQREQAKWRQERAIETARRDQHWIEFAEDLRANPDQLRKIPPLVAEQVDHRLYNLWFLLKRLGENRSRHVILDLSPLLPLFGDAVISALRDAFIAYWRNRRPVPKWKRSEAERNLVTDLELIGIVGVTQEAARDSTWATKLSHDDAELASVYATLEPSGLPSWVDDLAVHHPLIVRDVLWNNVLKDLESTDPDAYPMALSHLDNASETVAEAVAQPFVDWLSEDGDASPEAVERVLRLLRQAPSVRTRVAAIASSRILYPLCAGVRAEYFAAFFVENPADAVSYLDNAVAGLEEAEQTILVQACLAALSNDRDAQEAFLPGRFPFDCLLKFVQLAFAKVHPSADNNHPGDVGHIVNRRDAAEEVRNALFKTLTETPGFATYRALGNLRESCKFPMPTWRMLRLETTRAEVDSELEPWSPDDVLEFQDSFFNIPATSQELLRVALVHLQEIEHQLLHGDFNQGAVVAALRDETAVQNWFADRIQSREGRSFTLEREPHLADEKEPDIRLSSRVSDARCPIEIKIAENWSLSELNNALDDQLCGRYLRDTDNRYGVLLLIHQKARPKGWKSGSLYLQFSDVVSYLRSRAREISADDPLSPQPAIFAIDLTGCGDVTVIDL